MGIHAPEFAYERDAAAVAAEVRREKLDYPQLLDNDFAYWKALGIEAWPTFLLVDRCGRLRAREIGEVHRGEASGWRLEKAIEGLLKESASCGVN